MANWLLDLQRKQRAHDREYHADIYYLSYPDRMRHIVFHFSKYVGRLAMPSSNQDSAVSLRKTIVDTFLMALSASEVLNLDLDRSARPRLAEECGVPQSADSIAQWWLLRLAASTGKMAKAMESLDHMEPVNSRQMLSESTIEILESVLAISDRLALNPGAEAERRWEEIRRLKIL